MPHFRYVCRYFDVSPLLTYESSFPRWRCTCVFGGDPCCCLRNRRNQSVWKQTVKKNWRCRKTSGVKFCIQNVDRGAVSLGQRGRRRRRRGAMGTGRRCGQSRGGERQREGSPADAETHLLGHRGGNGRQAGEAGRGAGPAELLSPRPHLTLRSGPVPTEADSSRPERGEGEDAGGAGGVRLQGLPACGGLPGSGCQTAGELGEVTAEITTKHTRCHWSCPSGGDTCHQIMEGPLFIFSLKGHKKVTLRILILAVSLIDYNAHSEVFIFLSIIE